MAHSLAAAAGMAQAQPISGLGGRTAFLLIAVVVVIVAVVAVIPIVMDVRRATAWRQQLTDRLIDQAADDPDVRDFLRDLREPRGVRGLTRSIIAVLILALVGFALAVTLLSTDGDAADLRKTIVTSLMTVLATVSGFYFGTLGAQNSAEDARRRTATAPRGPGKGGAKGASAVVGGADGGGGATEVAVGVAVGTTGSAPVPPTTAGGPGSSGASGGEGGGGPASGSGGPGGPAVPGA